MGKRHGLYHTPAYKRWASMMRRCYNATQDNYARYGGIGITVDKNWHNPVNFINDMGQPEAGMTLERINSTLNYGPSNCRWATVEEQNANRKHVQKLHGRIAAHVAKENGIKIDAFHRRVQRGWTLEAACTTPVRKVKQ